MLPTPYRVWRGQRRGEELREGPGEMPTISSLLSLLSYLAQQLCTGRQGTGMGAGEGVRGNGEKGGYSLMAPVYVGCVRSLGTFL